MATTTTTSSNPLWDIQSQYLPGTFSAATEIYNQGAPGYYPGQTVADFDPLKAQGLNLGVDAALGAQSDLATGQSNLLSGILGGTDAGTQQLAQQAAQATGGAFGQSGTFGGARHAQAANNAAAQTILDRQLDASGQVAAAQANALAPGQTLSNIGTTTQQYNQALLDADKDRYDYNVNQPFNWLTQYQNSLGLANAQPSTTSSTSSKPSTLETVLGVGGLLFSDARLKSGITKVGEYKGHNLYSYFSHAYNRPEIGVLAQEVQQKRPDLVSTHSSGYLQVNYGGL